MSTCQKARAALAMKTGVIRVHPYGHNGKVIVYVSDRDALDQESVAAALELQDLRLRKIRAR